MTSNRKLAAVLLLSSIASMPAAGQDLPGLTQIRMEYCAFIDDGDASCASAFAALELRFPGSSSALYETAPALLINLVPDVDSPFMEVCSHDGMICAVPSDNPAAGSVCVDITVDAGSIPEGVFGDYIDVSVSLRSSDPTGRGCVFPERSVLRMYTDCLDPPMPGDMFRKGGGVRFRVLEVSPPDCGLIPISTEPRSWGGIKALYK